MNKRTEVLFKDALSLAVGLLIAAGAVALLSASSGIVLALLIIGGALLVYSIILALIWGVIDTSDW